MYPKPYSIYLRGIIDFQLFLFLYRLPAPNPNPNKHHVQAQFRGFQHKVDAAQMESRLPRACLVDCCESVQQFGTYKG